jgi:hypothetical protein
VPADWEKNDVVCLQIWASDNNYCKGISILSLAYESHDKLVNKYKNVKSLLSLACSTLNEICTVSSFFFT